jgi:hypothetical protein
LEKTHGSVAGSDAPLLDEELGAPPSALQGPCQRCWIYPRAPAKRGTGRYCRVCRAILVKASRLHHLSPRSIVIWGAVNRLPKLLERRGGVQAGYRILGAYAPDAQHFIVMMYRQGLKSWLQELVIYHGTELRGVLQILPTTGRGGGVDMADVLCRAMYQETLLPMDRLRVRFFSAPHQVLKSHLRDRQGLLTFEIAEFVSLLEMAAVFRTLLEPEVQRALFELLNLKDSHEEHFYWGRFLGLLTPEARDMLNAWRIRQWPKERIRLLYELIGYVSFYPLD